MKRILAALISLGLLAGSAGAADQPKLKTEKERVSYAIGFNLGSSMKRDGVEVDGKVLLQAMQDAQTGRKALLDPEQRRAAIVELRKTLMAKRQAEQAKQAKANKKKAQAFLDANRKKPGVKTTKSGLQYRVITAGKGKIPKLTDTVSVHYRGRTLDGKEFDSSYKRKRPAVFPVKGVIKGWQEALTKMKVGSKWEVFIPADLAYGDRGAPPRIQPGSALIFEMELLSIKDKKAASPHMMKPAGAKPGHAKPAPAKK